MNTAHKAVPCEWNGVQYASINAAAKTQGISYAAMHRRLRCGYTCDSDMQRAKEYPCEWNGIQYKTINAAAIANHISKEGMHYRVHQGYKCDGDMQR